MHYGKDHRTLRLGTRRSLLAWAQSSWVARELRRIHSGVPGFSVELVGIETRGDKNQNTPLSQIEGKELFVAELDEALRTSQVDFTVHSMKDLSLDRPSELTLACIPKRENPRDVLLMSGGALKRLRRGEELKIGTSSPRRLENVPAFLSQALPRLDGQLPRARFVEIRGNVNTRISRLHEPEGSERLLDGVILAFAGLIRLWADEAARPELGKLLRTADGSVRWMVLPLRECPTAAAQGALAVECRASDAEVLKLLGALNDPAQKKHIARERDLLGEWGGGCHQRFGATSIPTREMGEMFFVRGVKPDGSFVSALDWALKPLKPLIVQPRAQTWDGSRWRAQDTSHSEVLSPDQTRAFGAHRAVFLAHSRALPTPWVSLAREMRVWTSGVASWFRLARQGIWVEGCAEGLGFGELAPTLEEKALELPALSEWAILTHKSAVSGWKNGQVFATYRLDSGITENPGALMALTEAQYVFWSSGSQFEAYHGRCRKDARHACGPGKTAKRLREAGIHPDVFPSVEDWKKWINPGVSL